MGKLFVKRDTVMVRIEKLNRYVDKDENLDGDASLAVHKALNELSSLIGIEEDVVDLDVLIKGLTEEIYPLCRKDVPRSRLTELITGVIENGGYPPRFCDCYVDGFCWGTKEKDICSCEGNELNCTFYAYKRAKART